MLIRHDNETITAPATAPGMGAVALIRISGPDAIQVAAKIFRGKKAVDAMKSHTVIFGLICNGDHVIDEVVLTLFKGPRSYTGEDTVEISCHGSPFIQKQILQLIVSSGARMAAPGEFTLRAFMNGKLDLSQAEAVADLIASTSEASHRVAWQQLRGGYSDRIRDMRDKLVHFAALIELELDFSEEDVEFADRVELKDHVMKDRKSVV